MKYIKNFLKLFEDEKPVISYDFDGTLHRSVIGLDPINFSNWESWEPYTEMIDQLREDAKDHRIFIVTARDGHDLSPVVKFVEHHKLPVEEIIGTDNEPKYDTLEEIGAIKHYDDNAKMKDTLEEMGIEFVLTNPLNKMTESSVGKTKFEISFTNPQFYISDNTLTAFVNRLRRLDPDLIYDPRWNGRMKDSKILYVTSSVLRHEDIKGEINSFVKRYDHLQMQVVIPKVNESDAASFFRLKMLRKQAAGKRRSEKNAELESIELNDEEIKQILLMVKSKKSEVMEQLPALKKLQKMGLIRNPKPVEAASSFGFPFYLTDKGEAFIKTK